MKQTLVISCPASSRSGYGDHSRDLIRSLIAMDKFDISVMDQRWGMCPRTALESEPEISKLVLPKGEQLMSRPDIWMQVTVPNEFQKVGKFNIGVTAGIETDRVSHEWIEGMNRMDMNIVPSQHAKVVFEQTTYDQKNDNGDTIKTIKNETPIHVLFEGLNTDIFDKNEQASFSGIDDIPESFCYLVCGHWLQGDMGQDRKDLAGTIQTFIHTFKGSADVKPAMVLKTSQATFSVTDREVVLSKVRNIQNSCGVPREKQPNIYVLHGDLTESEMNGLYNHSKIKAMLSLTHGEGFGRPLLEFSVTGKPTIATDWSGHTDFLGTHTFKIPGKVDLVHESALQDGMIIKDSKWFFADYNYASKLLKESYKKYKSFTATSRKQRKFVKDNFSLQAMTEEFNRLITDNIPEPVKLKLPKLKLPKLEKVNE
tara:strand:- start:376 stop:1653 length:1278 start_codon:yes stop_codon:yes gene_type:complete